MKRLTTKAAIFLILAIIGVIGAVYSVKMQNYTLLVVAILFAGVSADNIFCNLKKK